MNPIASLRQKRAKAVDRMQALNKSALAVDRDLNAEEKTEYDGLRESVKSMDEQIKRLEEADRLAAESARELPSSVEVGKSGAEEGAKNRKPGDFVARAARALAATKGDFRRAAKFAEESLLDAGVAKALAADNASGGGFAIPENYSAEFIELYYPQSVVRASGARTVPLANGNMTVPKVTGGATAGYIGENSLIPASQPSAGQVKLTGRKLGILVPISNDLIRKSSPSADTMVRADMEQAASAAENQNFLRGLGTGAGPKGLRYQANAANILAVNATTNLVNVTADLSRLMLALMNNNVPTATAGWLTSPRVKLFLADIRDGNGNKAFPEIDRNELRGYPIKTTTDIPINLAVTDTNESELYFVNFADVVIGDSLGLTLEVSSEASYVDSTGATVSAFQSDQTLIKMILEHDIALRHNLAVAVLKDVDWGS